MSPLLVSAIALVRGWTRFYTLHLDPPDRDRRRDEIESDLWEFHEEARRRGYPPGGVAAHMVARLVFGIPHDLLWRIEYEGDAAMTHRRSTWMTAAAIVATVCIGALWALFAVASISALPPLPDSVHIERVYLQPMRLPPPPPPPPPRGSMVIYRSALPPPPVR